MIRYFWLQQYPPNFNSNNLKNEGKFSAEKKLLYCPIVILDYRLRSEILFEHFHDSFRSHPGKRRKRQ